MIRKGQTQAAATVLEAHCKLKTIMICSSMFSLYWSESKPGKKQTLTKDNLRHMERGVAVLMAMWFN